MASENNPPASNLESQPVLANNSAENNANKTNNNHNTNGIAVRTNLNKEANNSDENSDKAEDELDVHVLSSDKRWQRKSTIINLVKKGDFQTHLAVDLKTGREVLWNRIDLSDRNFTEEENKSIADHLKILNSLKKTPYTAKFLAYWIDSIQNSNHIKGLKIYFITENFGSVSLNHFLKSKKTKVDTKSWCQWCRQILLGINFLHSANPPLVHGNINSHTIYFDQSGTLKLCFIGFLPSVFFNKINMDSLRKTNEKRPFNYDPPDFKRSKIIKKSLDVFDFGLVALKIAVTPVIIPDSLYTPYKFIELIDDQSTKKMIRKCLSFSPKERPSAANLLLNEALFKIPPLQAIILNIYRDDDKFLESYMENIAKYDGEKIIADNKSTGAKLKYDSIDWSQKRDYIDKVKQNNISSLVLLSHLKKFCSPNYPEFENGLSAENDENMEEKKYEKEMRRIAESEVKIDPQTLQLVITVTFTDESKRKFSTEITKDERAIELAEDLVFNGVLNEYDINIIASQIQFEQSELVKS